MQQFKTQHHQTLYTLEVALCDIFVFPKLQMQQSFDDIETIDEGHSKNFHFHNCFRDLKHRLERFVKSNGDYHVPDDEE